MQAGPSSVHAHGQAFSALPLGSVETLLPASKGKAQTCQDTWQVCPCNVTTMGALQVLQAQQIQT